MFTYSIRLISLCLFFFSFLMAAFVNAAETPTTEQQLLPAPVLTGLENLLPQADEQLGNKRLALIINPSSINAAKIHIIDLLYPKYRVVKLFAPEHGVRGQQDEPVANGVDEKTGLPIISLYQPQKKAPNAQDLQDVDVLIFDIQEIGVRYYTYATTLVLAMKAAQQNKKQIIVLDRPNMAGSLGVFGPLLEKEFWGGFASYYPIPISHGMTIGELAKYYNQTFEIGANLLVVPLSNYQRKQFYDETLLPWVNPSPNIRQMEAVIAYQIMGALEAMSLSVGRGTDQPFLVYGNPKFDAQKISTALNQAQLPGLKFEPIEFIPQSSKFVGLNCKGFKLVITDRQILNPVRTFLTVTRQIYLSFPENERENEMKRVGAGVGSRKLLKAIAKGTSFEQLERDLAQELEPFLQSRSRFLMYP